MFLPNLVHLGVGLVLVLSAKSAFLVPDKHLQRTYTDYVEDVIDKMPTYCEAPLNFTRRLVDDKKSGPTHVFVFHRHGDRAPLHSLRDDSDHVWHCGQTLAWKDGKSLLKLQYKAPKYTGNLTTWQGDCQIGQLTKKGADQMKKLGTTMRTMYKPYFDREDVHFYSTLKERTIASTLHLTKGLGFDKVSVNVTANVMDPLHVYGFTNLCRRFHNYFVESRTHSLSRWVQSKNRLFLKRMMKIIGPSIHTENMMCRYCHNQFLPCQNGKCVTENDLQHFYALKSWDKYYTTWVYPTLMNENDANMYRQVSLGPLLHLIKSVVMNNEKSLLFLSTHDTALAAIYGILAMDSSDYYWTPYASTVIFERHATGQWYVSYNAKPFIPIDMGEIIDKYSMEPEKWQALCDT